MLWCFIVYLALSMLSLNRGSVNASAMGRQKVSKVMRRQNLLFTLGLIALVLIIAATPAVIKALEEGWNMLMTALKQLAAWLSSLLPQPTEREGAGGAPPDMGMLPMEESEPSAFAMVMEKVAMAIGAVLALAALYVFGRMLYRRLKVLLRYLWQRLTQYAAHASEDYEDEITDTRQTGEKERTGGLQRMLRWERVDEKTLSPQGRIRYRYQKLLRRHGDWKDGSTARENLPENAAELYEKARYSHHPVTEADAEHFAERVKRV